MPWATKLHTLRLMSGEAIMPDMPPVFRPSGQRTRRQVKREADQRRGSARERGYTAEWDRASRDFIAENPLCAYCAAGAWGDEPRDAPSVLTDHLYPQRTHDGVFWVRDWWVSSCADCHNGPKQAVEIEGLAALDRLAVLLDRPRLSDLDLPPRIGIG